MNGKQLAAAIYEWADKQAFHPDDFGILTANELLELLDKDKGSPGDEFKHEVIDHLKEELARAEETDEYVEIGTLKRLIMTFEDTGEEFEDLKAEPEKRLYSYILQDQHTFVILLHENQYTDTEFLQFVNDRRYEYRQEFTGNRGVYEVAYLLMEDGFKLSPRVVLT